MAQEFGFFTGDIDGAFLGKCHMVQVKYLIVKALQRALGQGNQADGEIQAGKPDRGFGQVGKIL
jgi:hypothetical protein